VLREHYFSSAFYHRPSAVLKPLLAQLAPPGVEGLEWRTPAGLTRTVRCPASGKRIALAEWFLIRGNLWGIPCLLVAELAMARLLHMAGGGQWLGVPFGITSGSFGSSSTCSRAFHGLHVASGVPAVGLMLIRSSRRQIMKARAGGGGRLAFCAFRRCDLGCCPPGFYRLAGNDH